MPRIRKWRRLTPQDQDYAAFTYDTWVTKGPFFLQKSRGMFGRTRWVLYDEKHHVIAVQEELFHDDVINSGPPIRWANSWL